MAQKCRRSEHRLSAASNLAQAERYRQDNLASARIILTDVDGFGGESALAVIWARMTVRNEADRRRAA
jgi:hypothetical protein